MFSLVPCVVFAFVLLLDFWRRVCVHGRACVCVVTYVEIPLPEGRVFFPLSLTSELLLLNLKISENKFHQNVLK